MLAAERLDGGKSLREEVLLDFQTPGVQPSPCLYRTLSNEDAIRLEELLFN